MTAKLKVFEVDGPDSGDDQSRKRSFAFREFVLAGVALLSLVLCFVFVGLYIHEQEKTSNCKTNEANPNTCITKGCLQASARILDLMDSSVDPCEDFYQYACGNYKNVRSVSYGEETRSVLRDINHINEYNLIDTLRKPIDPVHDQLAKRKLKEFFQSCTDVNRREKLLARPFLDKVLPALGGWDLLGTWNETDWDFNTVLKTVQSTFSTDAFYSVSIEPEWDDDTKRVIQLKPGGAGKWMEWDWYVNSHTQKYRDDYQKFIRRVGSLLMRDAKVTNDSDTQAAKLDQFVNDTITMETIIAQLVLQSEETYWQVFFDDLSNNVINWLDQMSYLFSEATITRYTHVLLESYDYFHEIPTMISNLPDTDRKRILHNYLVWRVAERYVQHMSLEYFNVNSEIYVDIHGESQAYDLHPYCFAQLEIYMADALGALYISDHFVHANKQHVKDIADHLKTVVLEEIDQTPWMDNRTKAYAKDKLAAISYKLGFPDWMADVEGVNSIYSGLTLNISDFFGNILSANGFLRSLWSTELMEGSNREEWLYEIYKAAMSSIPYWNAFEVSAGALQSPIYDHSQPLYTTFGFLGGYLGRFLHLMVDDFGQRYSKNGTNLSPDSWWTDKTIENYKPIRNCVINAFRDATINLTYPDGQNRTVSINPLRYAPLAASIINGIRTGLKGYRKWMSERGINERMLPGLDLTDDQMVFLSFGQGICFQRSISESLRIAASGSLEQDIHVNIVMSQLSEFSDAFQCKKTAKMNANEKCDLQ